MADASAKRAQDSKSITDKESAKAETETELETDTENKNSKTIEAMETAKEGCFKRRSARHMSCPPTGHMGGPCKFFKCVKVVPSVLVRPRVEMCKK